VKSFRHDQVEIAFLDEGEGDPVVLVHGFASNATVNWVQPGWVSFLAQARRRVIALDNRGHGASTKLYDPADYHSSRMAGDVAALLDHLGLERADVMGYSMGARIAAFLALEHPERVRGAIFGGLGSRLVEGFDDSEAVAHALETHSLENVSDVRSRMFRVFAEQTKSDLRALAACIRGSGQTLTPTELAQIRLPVLVAVGENDVVGGSAAELSRFLPAGEALEIPRRDHMTAVGDKVYKQAVVEFLKQ